MQFSPQGMFTISIISVYNISMFLGYLRGKLRSLVKQLPERNDDR